MRSNEWLVSIGQKILIPWAPRGCALTLNSFFSSSYAAVIRFCILNNIWQYSIVLFLLLLFAIIIHLQ